MSEADDVLGASLPVLDALEARVLGVLVEKAAATPEVYPLTLNAVQLGCNQKTNREPVMHAELGEVGHALRTLEEKKLVRASYGARVQRYEHTFDAALNLTPRSRAVMALLLLRGPQTQGELFVRSQRLADFPDGEILGDTLERLIAREPPLVVRLGRASGQREDRYMHLLSGPVSADSYAVSAPADAAISASGDLVARVEELERIVADLQRRLGGDS
ncbi:MAG TPA: DUF480 domain-containing protein [Rudaea sp.]|nr:DUF480 domain-containing protein [Rudaea sp.]